MKNLSERHELIARLSKASESRSLQWRISSRHTEIYTIYQTRSISLGIIGGTEKSDRRSFRVLVRDSDGNQSDRWTTADCPDLIEMVALLYNQATLVAHDIDRRIDNARRLCLPEINFSNMGMTSIPDAISDLKNLKSLDLRDNFLTHVPDFIGHIASLRTLNLSNNGISSLPISLSRLEHLQSLNCSNNGLSVVPKSICELAQLEELDLSCNQLAILPESCGQITHLSSLYLASNRIESLPEWIGKLGSLKIIDLDGNPLNPELAAAYNSGTAAVKLYSLANGRIPGPSSEHYYEAKLILVGEGGVGKSSLLSSLRGETWEESRPTTHGIEVKSLLLENPDNHAKIKLHGWDFGGQRIYWPTHQLFFSAPAVYLVVWKPREGSQQGFVKEWIQLIKHREPDAKILVVATYGGPGGRLPDIDRQEIRDLYGNERVLGFFHVENKPDANGQRKGVDELKQAIARVAVSLPEVGRTIPERWRNVQDALEAMNVAYLRTSQVCKICREHGMNDDEAQDFVRISHRLGHLIHYENDPLLRDLVILKPDWLATAISLVLDDPLTRENHGLVTFARLSQLWDNPYQKPEQRYPTELHRVFRRLMERFDLSYRVAGTPLDSQAGETSLIAQLVPDTRPMTIPEWSGYGAAGDSEKVQICRIVDAASGQSAPAEGLFYQLIVRLHRFSLGRTDYKDSIHWQRGILLDDGYNGRAFMEHVGNDVRITVRAPYPETFLAVLTGEVKWLVENFWEGLRCSVMVPCVEPCGMHNPGTGLFEVEKLIESKRQNRTEYPCPLCNEWQNIDALLRNTPAVRPHPLSLLLEEFGSVKGVLSSIRERQRGLYGGSMGRFDRVDETGQRILSRVDDAFSGLMNAFTDEAKDGPRLFSFEPVDKKKFNPQSWVHHTFKLTLWCEHSRLPLPVLSGGESKEGMYEIDLPREWFVRAAPYLKTLTATLSLVLPMASSSTKLLLDEATFKAVSAELDFGKNCAEAVMKGAKMDLDEMTELREPDFIPGETGEAEFKKGFRAEGTALRELHAMLKAIDPNSRFGNLVRVQNKRHEFLWVHPQFASEY